MSWEKFEYVEIAQCACRQGKVIKHCCNESDDWGRSRDGEAKYDIECPNCKAKYHVDAITRYQWCPSWISDGFSTREYLVPNGMDLPKPLSNASIQTGTIEGEIASLFTIEALQHAIVDMTESKFSTRVKLPESTRIVSIFSKRLNVKALGKIIPVLQGVIDNYDTYPWNPVTVAKYRQQEAIKIEETEKAIAEVLSKSFALDFSRVLG